jgi:hypothetical protein
MWLTIYLHELVRVKLNFEFWHAYIIANLFSYLNLLGSLL